MEEPGRSWWLLGRRWPAQRRWRDRRTRPHAPAGSPTRRGPTAAGHRGAGSQPGIESRRAAPGCTSDTLRRNPSGSTCTRTHSSPEGSIRPPSEEQLRWLVLPSTAGRRRRHSVEVIAFEGPVGVEIRPDPRSLVSRAEWGHGTPVPSGQYVSTAASSCSLREGTLTSTLRTSHNSQPSSRPR
jgi:hypothetical protein